MESYFVREYLAAGLMRIFSTNKQNLFFWQYIWFSEDAPISCILQYALITSLETPHLSYTACLIFYLWPFALVWTISLVPGCKCQPKHSWQHHNNQKIISRTVFGNLI